MNVSRSFARIRARWGWLFWGYRSLRSVAGALLFGWLAAIHRGYVDASPVWEEATETVMAAFDGQMWFYWFILAWLPYWALKSARRAVRLKP